MVQEGKLFSNTLLLGVSAAVSKALSFLLLPFYTSALSPAAFGVCEILLSTAVLMISLFSLYAPQATFRFWAQRERGAITAGLWMLGGGLLIFTISIPLWGMIPVLRPYRALLYLYVLSSLAHGFVAHILRAEGKFALFAAQQSFCALSGALFQILFLRVWRMGSAGYLLGIALGDAVTFFCLLPVFWLSFWQNRGSAKQMGKKMLRFALPLMPAALLWWGMSAADRYILLYFHGTRATGLYAAAGRFPALVAFAASVFLEAWHYAALQNGGEAPAVRFGRVYALILPAFLALGGAVMAISPLLVRLFLSAAYAKAARVVGFLLFGAVCAGMANFLDSIYTLQMRSNASLISALFAVVLHVGFSFLLIPPLGAIGASMANALGFLALFVIRCAHTARFLKFPRHAKAISQSLFCLFSGALFLAVERRFFATVLALISIFPLRGQLYSSVSFLWGRSRVFVMHLIKRKNVLKKSEKYDKIKLSSALTRDREEDI